MMLVLTVGLAKVRSDEFYLWLYTYEASPRAIDSHTFATVARVTQNGTYYHSISWMPATLIVRIVARPEPGINLTYEQTLALARSKGALVVQYGPYRINPFFYNAFLARVAQLNSGAILYKANDRDTYPMAVNCIHAVSGIVGRLRTGMTWGRLATEQVINYFGLGSVGN